jgi:hypothetical protein
VRFFSSQQTRLVINKIKEIHYKGSSRYFTQQKISETINSATNKKDTGINKIYKYLTKGQRSQLVRGSAFSTET